MSLPREFVGYLSKRMAAELIKREMVEVKNPSFLWERIHSVTEEELAVEERINDEVRNILKDHAEEMRHTGVSYQEMFKRVKSRLVKEKKVIL